MEDPLNNTRNISLDRALASLLGSKGNTLFQSALSEFLSSGQLSREVRYQVEKYLHESQLYHPLDSSRYRYYYEDRNNDVRSVFFESAMSLIYDSIIARSTKVRNILGDPSTHTLGALLDALREDAIDILAGVSESKKRRLTLDYHVFGDQIDSASATLMHMLIGFSDSLDRAILPSQKRHISQKDPQEPWRSEGLYVESSFAFYSLADRYPSSRYFPAPERDRRSCLDRSMGRYAPIGNNYIFSYLPTEEQVLGRQEEMESLLSSEAFGGLSSMLGKGWGQEEWAQLGELEKALCYSIDEDGNSHHDVIGYLWKFVRGESYHDVDSDDIRIIGWKYLGSMVHDLCASLERNINAYKSFIHLCSQVPLWQERATAILELLAQLKGCLSPEALLGGYGIDSFGQKQSKGGKPQLPKKEITRITSTYQTIDTIVGILMQEGRYFSDFIHLAEMVMSEKWTKISFDQTKPFAYTGGRHPNKSLDDQVSNPSHRDTEIVVYSGANTSGKSWGLQRDFIIRRAAQVLGYAPVDAGNFPKRYDMMVFLDRANTNAREKRSAYMEEIDRIIKMLKEGKGKRCLVYVDEPFSTTAPSDQPGMIETLIDKVTILGGDIVIATHSEDAMKGMSEGYGDTVGFFHYDYKVERDESGRPYISTKYRLEAGVADSCSLDIAEIEGAPPDMLAMARDYYDGNTLPYNFGKKDFSLKSEGEPCIPGAIGLRSMFRVDCDDTLFFLYSTDRDFAVSGLQNHHRGGIFTTDQRKGKHLEIPLEALVDIAEVQRLMSLMILGSGQISSGDFHARQRLFSLLSENMLYKKILHRIPRIADKEDDFRSVGRQRKDGINKSLNPISVPRDHFFGPLPRLSVEDSRFGISEVDSALSFLLLHQKLLDKIPSEVGALIRELRHYTKFIKKYSDRKNHTFNRINTKGYTETSTFIEAFLDKRFNKDFPGESSEFLTLAKEYFSSYIPGGIRTFGDLHEYFGSLRQRMVTIGDILPALEYDAFEKEGIEEYLERYLSLVVNKITRGSNSSERIRGEKRKVRRDTSDGFFSFGGMIQNRAEETTRSLLTILRFKRDYQEFRTFLTRIDDPYIRNCIVLLDSQYERLLTLEVDEDRDERGVKHMLSKTKEGHNTRERAFRHTIQGREELKRFAFTSELDRLSTLCIYASYIAQGDMHRVVLNETGEVRFLNNKNMFEVRHQSNEKGNAMQGNDFLLDSDRPAHILTGPNGSGKTFFGKSGVVSTLQALSTGFSYGRDVTIPLFDRIIYLDRVNEQNGVHSSFASELRYWKEVWEYIEKGERILIFCDEMFSTVQPKYQSALSDAVMRKLVGNGIYIVTASHHHDWVEGLSRGNPGIPISHLDFEIQDGKPIFYRRLTAGHAKSHAKEVAKMLGFE